MSRKTFFVKKTFQTMAITENGFVAYKIQKEDTSFRSVLTDRFICLYFFLYPHFGQTPFSSSATPQRGHLSIDPAGLNSADAALTPLVKVIFTMFNLSFSRSCTILIMPATVIVSFVTTRRQSG